MATPGQSSVKSMTVALRAGVTAATLPDNRKMVQSKNYAVSLEDYAKITTAARENVINSTPNTANTIVPLSDGTHYALNLTDINNIARDSDPTHDPHATLWADTQSIANWKEGQVVQGFNGDAFQLVRAATGTATISAGTPVAWGGVDTVVNPVSTYHVTTAKGKKNYVVTSDLSDITEAPTLETPDFAGIAVDTIAADAYGWIQISGNAVAAVIDATVAAGDVVSLDENVDGTLTSPTNEVKTVALGSADTDNTFTLTFGGQTTTEIPWDSAATAVQAALVALSSIGAGNVSVVRSGTTPNWIHTITFIGDLAHTNVGALTGTGTGCTLTIVENGTGASIVGSGGLRVVGTATAVSGSAADVELRDRTTVNRHIKRAKLFFEK